MGSSSSCAPALEQSIASTTGKVVLVTGTAGFVGFYTALALKQRGDGVLGIDNFNSYYPVGLKRDRAATLEKAGVLTLEMDLNDGERLKALMDECRFTHILALAAQAGVRYATNHVCVLQLSLWPQHQGALFRRGPRGQPCQLVRGNEEGQRNDRTLL